MSDDFGNIGVVAFGGKRSPKQTLLDALSECDEYEQCIVLALKKDGDFCTGWSEGRYLNHIGMCTFAAHRFSEGMRDNVDIGDGDEPPDQAG